MECKPRIPAKSIISEVVALDKASSQSTPKSMSSVIDSSKGVFSGSLRLGPVHFFPLTVPGIKGTISGTSGVFIAFR